MSLKHDLGLKEDEEVLAVIRSAPITLLLPGIVVGTLLIGPLVFMVPIIRLDLLGYAILAVCWTVGLLIMGRVLAVWLGTIMFVTDRRVIIVRRPSVFSRHVIELSLSRIQQVAFKVEGFMPTVGGYGTLLIESTAGSDVVEVHRVSKPKRIQDMIHDLVNEEEAPAANFGDLLHAVSDMSVRELGLLKAEIERTLRLLRLKTARDSMPHMRTQPDRPARRFGALIAGLAVLSLLSGAAFFREHMRARQIDGEIRSLKDEAERLRVRTFEISSLEDSLKSGEFLEHEARLKLGLQKAGEVAVVVRKETPHGASDPDAAPQAPRLGDDWSNPRKWFTYFADPHVFSDYASLRNDATAAR